MSISYPVVLTIATTDSGGGAGIQADLKTITVLGGYGASVVAALTAQNGAEVLGIHTLPTDFIRLQYKAVDEGFPIRAAKLGMLFSTPIMETVADMLQNKKFPLVVDPVSVSQSGYSLLEKDAVATLKQRILPMADLLTPNRQEAEMLADMPINSQEDVEEAARRILAFGPKAVLIKGGHFSGGAGFGVTAGKDIVVDWLVMQGGTIISLAHRWVHTSNNHGTGCTLAAAIATYLGFGFPLEEAITEAQHFLTDALRTAFTCGRGPGAPNFLGGALAVLGYCEVYGAGGPKQWRP